MSAMIRRKLQYLLTSGKVREYRQWLGSFSSLFRGLPIDWRTLRAIEGTQRHHTTSEVDEFLAAHQFTSAVDRPHGTSTLLVAAGLGHVQVMEALLKCRASMNCKERCGSATFGIFAGMRPLHMASLHGHAVAASVLMQQRANLNERTKLGDSPMFFAMISGVVEVQQELMRSRADMSERNAMAMTLLDISVAAHKVDSMRFALTHGVSRACSIHGMNALHTAAAFDATQEMASMLVEAGISLTDRFRPTFGSVWWLLSAHFVLLYRLCSADMVDKNISSFTALAARRCTSPQRPGVSSYCEPSWSPVRTR
eukprot:CAMPEP_0176101754 /NCGR_PEP_ID=MMETSP0120_2-20121206/51036_1 /TAXON_ID=160619 /ORGANISM="Kryptoperidinium foliaceum, Strain CCMP 1326" /LENGTH=310 /DNA_ID=CAMNT_0017435805 /DNA_START=246 /DNA_END=1174 /DNA_ORIENTATION=-